MVPQQLPALSHALYPPLCRETHLSVFHTTTPTTPQIHKLNEKKGSPGQVWMWLSAIHENCHKYHKICSSIINSSVFQPIKPQTTHKSQEIYQELVGHTFIQFHKIQSQETFHLMTRNGFASTLNIRIVSSKTVNPQK